MEITMYEDSYSSNISRENVAQMKRKFTLDLNNCRTPKKIRSLQTQQASFNPLLTSPDLKMLKLASPELDQLVLQGGLLPSGFSFPTPVSKTPTVSQEEFVKGFQDTLEQYHNKNNSTTEVVLPVVVTTSSITSSVVPVSSNGTPALQYTQLEVQQPPLYQHQVPVTSVCGGDDHSTSNIFIKEEPQTVPSGTPPLSPINMENQEKIKLERKRLRNRIAASKCRRRKLERISKLEDKVDGLKNENIELQAVVNRMRDQVCVLKQEVMEHINSGCEIPFLATQ